MDVESSTKIFRDLHSDDLCFVYSGSISDIITHKIIELTQFNIDSSGNFVKLKNKISFLMAECYQNVVRHGKTDLNQTNIHDKANAFFVRSIGNSFFITSSNIVKNQDIEIVKEKLDRVNNLTIDELKALQKQVLSKGKLSEKGGAGLGIIEMARRTGKKIRYVFDKVNEESSIFYLQLELKNQEELALEDDSGASLQLMKSLHELMVKENILILHKGDFAEHSVLPVIQMIEKNLHRETDTKTGKQRLYNVSVELLQNISMHAHRNNGVNEALFILGRVGDQFYISTTNYIERPKVEHLLSQLHYLKGLSKIELNELYREKLQGVIDCNETGTGIGLIYIFRKCHTIDYHLLEKDNLPQFTIIITVNMTSAKAENGS